MMKLVWLNFCHRCFDDFGKIPGLHYRKAARV